MECTATAGVWAILVYARPNPVLQEIRDRHNALVDEYMQADPAARKVLKNQIREVDNEYWKAKGISPGFQGTKTTPAAVVRKRGRPPGSKNKKKVKR